MDKVIIAKMTEWYICLFVFIHQSCSTTSKKINCIPAETRTVLLAHMAFALPVKLSLSQPMSFLTFPLLILSPIPLGGSEQVAVWCLAGGRG